MLLGEFLERVPEGTDADFADANALYTALPNMDKDDFCMLYRVEMLLGLSLFDGLRNAVEAFEEWCKKRPHFVDSVKGLHTQKVAATFEERLKKNLADLRKVFGKEAC